MLNRSRLIRFGRSEEAADRLIWGDNLELMQKLPDGSIDLIYVDPPFGTGAAKRGSTGAGYRDRTGDPEQFVSWLLPRLEHGRRCLAPHGSLFVHLDYRSVHHVKVALDRLFGRTRFVNEIVWCYSVGGKSRRSFGRKHDTILWYSRSADYAFYPEAVRVARKAASHMRLVRDEDGTLVQEKTDRKTGRVYRYPVAAGKIPEDWWTDIETLNRGDRERTGWPTQKPERLLERILSAASRPGDLVADFFSGSGTTAAVAQRLDRRFLATDAEAAAVELACDRLETGGMELAQAGRPPRDLSLELAAEPPRGRLRGFLGGGSSDISPGRPQP